ncbi:MAG: high-affinity branched-chain amino acid ABC transporter ATP-binding protein LivG [Oscillatoriales cyanobacterium CG2_30_44_21]|nr:MAG: high-affinity branched-chain amino acid ABC transporter ATP-binding protein LivG [Oscillatoriales cyanobacterium CG2_30_44_21]
MSNSSTLTIQKISRCFGGLVAVNGVSFEVQEHEIFGVIGPNGAGKTTLFNTITGLVAPTSGKVFFEGKEITNRRPHQIAKFGIARTFQNIRLFGELSALENVAIARHLCTKSGLWDGILGLPLTVKEETQTHDRAWELLDLVGLSDRAEVKAKNFSYGDQRRLEIARALALQPKLLLLDEPAAGMNPSEKGQLSDFICGLRARFDLTILLIEHHVPLVMGLCDRIAVLDFGRLIAIGQPETVRSDRAVIEAYLGDEG